MMGKILKVVMLLAVMVSTVGAKTWKAGEKVTANLSGGTLTISGTGPMLKSEIKDGIYPPPPWLGSKGAIRNVVIENGVTSITNIAFIMCTNMTSVTIPNSVTSIGEQAFRGCTGLTSITIPNSVKSIGQMAFHGCTGLTSITIPNSVKSIGQMAFSECIGLTSITIPNSVTSLGEMAFYGCTGLTSITLPNSIKSIGPRLLSGLTGLTSVTIPNGVTSIEDGAFIGLTGLTSVTIPNSVKSIGNNAFNSCTGLKSITIPKSVTSIGRGAFYGCTNITSMTIPNISTVTSSGLGFSALKSVTITGSGEWAIDNILTISSNCSITDVVIEDGITSIGAFTGCNGLTSITVLNPKPPLAQYAFSGINKEKACLYVPSGSIDAYSSSDDWKLFTCIKDAASR
jgi:hypothetical protein